MNDRLKRGHNVTAEQSHGTHCFLGPDFTINSRVRVVGKGIVGNGMDLFGGWSRDLWL